MKDQRRIGAGFLCAALVLTLLVSSAFILHEAGHECTGEDCPICQAVAMNSQLLRLIGAALLAAALLPGVLRTGHAWAHANQHTASVSGTLVSWKIRLNN